MRTIEEVQKDQTQTLYDLGFHMARVDQLRELIKILASEAKEIHKVIKEEKEQ